MLTFWILLTVGVTLLTRRYMSEVRRGPLPLSGEGAVARKYGFEISRSPENALGNSLPKSSGRSSAAWNGEESFPGASRSRTSQR